MTSRIPPGIHCAADYARLAGECLDPATFAYIAGGSGDEMTLADNQRAFTTCRIVPRMLRDLRQGHTRCTRLGGERPHPLLLAPLAYQTLVNPAGEVDTARAAAATGTTLVASTLAGRTLEEIAAHAGPAPWFQLYFQPDRAVTVDLVRRAERAGYAALMVTLDASIKAPGRRAREAGFAFPPGVAAASLAAYPPPAQVVLAPGQSIIFQGAMADAPTWDDLAWLLAKTRLPIYVKGVLHPDDARRLQNLGVAGLVVSNHGGRALDGVPSSLAVLPGIRAAVGAELPLLFDSGVRSGSDVFKALALGADAVLVGRLQVYALAVAGALGVAHLLRLLCEELELCMAQAGCATLADIVPDLIFREKGEAFPC